MSKFLSSLFFSLTAAILLSLFFYFGFFNSWQEKLADKLFLEKQPPNNIIMIGIDDESLNALGQWPWPRQIHGQLLNVLSQSQMKLVVWDINFFENSRLGSQDDQFFSRALGKTSNLLTWEAISLKIRPSQIAEADSLAEPIEILKKEAIGLGHINTLTDDDGVLRKIPLYIKYQNNYFPSISLTAFCRLKDISLFDCAKPPAIFSWLGLKENNLRINYFGPPKTFLVISYRQVLEGEASQEIFKDKIVLIGVIAPDLHDFALTPVSRGEAMAGLEIQANALSTLLKGDFLFDLDRNFVIGLIFLMSLSGWLIVLLSRKIFRIILFLVAIFAFYNFSAFLFFEKGIIFNLLYPNLGLIFSAGLTVGWSYVSEQRERRRIYNMFSRFMDKNVIKELLAHKSEADLKRAKLKNITILFSDIEGFTALSEKMPPDILANFLNEYLTAMTKIVLEEKGVIDKYIGDAVMAFWGAPLDLEDHAERACRTALKMLEELKNLGDDWQKRGLPRVNIRLGVNTDQVVVGNIGSSLRFDYTIIGDGVNLASRLEGLNKEYGTNIIISQTTYELVKDKFGARYLGTAKIKGKEKEQPVYELVNYA